jgi:hypothetical protein
VTAVRWPVTSYKSRFCPEMRHSLFLVGLSHTDARQM